MVDKDQIIDLDDKSTMTVTATWKQREDKNMNLHSGHSFSYLHVINHCSYLQNRQGCA